ncbi:MAG: phosphoglucomutase/phosphomannomutase family protein [Halobacteriaceae archaeon]
MSAISFGTDGWRTTLDEFTVERVQMVAQGIANYLRERNTDGSTVIVGYDARKSSREYAEHVAEVLQMNEFDVIIPHRDLPTPIIAWTIVDRDLAGGIMITASHNPPEYNGLKFIPHDGAPALPEVTNAIEERIEEPYNTNVSPGNRSTVDILTPYLEYAKSSFAGDLSGLTVVYDAMHGSGRGVTDKLLSQAGADVHQLRCDQDPTFGGTPPEPSQEHLQELIDAVDERSADIGIANDGDADRIAIVTPKRGMLDENIFFGLLYDHLLDSQAGSAVRSVSTTFLIDRIAQAHNEDVIETQVGFKWIAKAMAEHDALIGGEESGGFTIRNHIREKDGVFIALHACGLVGNGDIDAQIDRLLSEYGEIYQSKRSVDCPDAEKERVLQGVEASIQETIAGLTIDDINTIDGDKILFDDGSWLLIRPSGTEPKMRIYAEASTQTKVETLLAAGQELVEAQL